MLSRARSSHVVDQPKLACWKVTRPQRRWAISAEAFLDHLPSRIPELQGQEWTHLNYLEKTASPYLAQISNPLNGELKSCCFNPLSFRESCYTAKANRQFLKNVISKIHAAQLFKDIGKRLHRVRNGTIHLVQLNLLLIMHLNTTCINNNLLLLNFILFLLQNYAPQKITNQFHSQCSCSSRRFILTLATCWLQFPITPDAEEHVSGWCAIRLIKIPGVGEPCVSLQHGLPPWAK